MITRALYVQQRRAVLSYKLLRRLFSTRDVESKIAIETTEDDKWMKSEGRGLLANFIRLPYPKTPIETSTINEYIQKRLETSLLTGTENFKHDESTMSIETLSQTRVLSSVLTFPLSMSFIMNACRSDQYHQSILVLGARSEASLPRLWWKELLISCRCNASIRIDFSGPQLPLQVSTGGVQLVNDKVTNLKWSMPQSSVSSSQSDMRVDDNSDNMVVERNISIANLPNGRCKLHELPEAESLLSEYNLLVLFNPGFGSHHLRHSWESSLKMILNSARSRPGVIVAGTAHSKWDLQRDVEQLKIVNNSICHSSESATAAKNSPSFQWVIEPTVNPYGSKKRTFDGQEEEPARVVTTNEYVYAFTYINS